MPELKLKNGWAKRRFDELATMITDRIDDPSRAGVERYVGLEHLDSDSLRISRWGVPSDVEATKLLFRKGDIIFGRRRAYQRKLAVADFDGICSAHAMVLRARPDIVVPEFLPFFMQSDAFMARAKEISVGSLSPTINWKTLAEQQFVLPPLSEQPAITAVFRALEAMDLALKELARRQADALSSFYQEVFGPIRVHLRKPSGSRLGDYCTVRRGASPRPIHDARWFSTDGPGWVRIRDLRSDSRFLRETQQKLSAAGVEKSVRVAPGEIILSIAATIGRPAIVDLDACIHDGFVVFKDLSSDLDRDYLFHFLRWMAPVLNARGQLGTQLNINAGIVEDLHVPIVVLRRQRQQAALMNDVFDSGQQIKERLRYTSRMRSLVLVQAARQ